MDDVHRFSCKVQSLDAATAPTLVVLLDDRHSSLGVCEQFVEEGYNVLQIRVNVEHFSSDVQNVAQHLQSQPNSPSFGIVSFELQKDHFGGLKKLSQLPGLKAVVHYTPADDDGVQMILRSTKGALVKTVFHVAASQEALQLKLLPFVEVPQAIPSSHGPIITMYIYPMVSSSPSFALTAPFANDSPVQSGPEAREDLAYVSARNMAYTRTLEALHATIGPWFDLQGLWQDHCHFEFNERNAEKTMATMVAKPYVNHIPTMTGGTGFEDLHRFYKDHFTDCSPPDTEIIPISRTVGVNRLVDEFLFRFTHTTEIDYLVPGIRPTGKSVEIPMVGIINFRGDKLVFEHLYWDQASVLVQLGLLDPAGLPIAGVEVARKMVNPFGEPSNTLLQKWSK